MTKTKMLSVMIILSATVATPALAQDAARRTPASNARGAYNQISYAGAQKIDRWTPANSGNVDKDPQITGGEDIARRAPGG